MGTSLADDDAEVVLFNPHPSPLTVNVTTTSGLNADLGTPIVVPAGSAAKFTMPSGSGAGFDASGCGFPDECAFFAIASIDEESTTHDWGHTVLPVSSLSVDLKVGWAPGRDSGSVTNPNENSSPIWITSAQATTVCVDFNDDGTPDLVDLDGLGILNPPVSTVNLTAYQSVRLFDPDGDQTGARIFSTKDANGNGCDTTGLTIDPKDGELIAGAWGQDPATASGGQPALDLGTTVLQVPPILVAKEGVLEIDFNGNGRTDPGDILSYELVVVNTGTSTAIDVTVIDNLDTNTEYVPNTTAQDGIPIADDAPTASPFPLDESGLNLGNLPPGSRVVLTFQVQIDPDLDPSVDSIQNQVRVTTSTGETSDDSAIGPVFTPDLRIDKSSNVVGNVLPGGEIEYTIVVTNAGSQRQTGISVTDALPIGTTYVDPSTAASGFSLTDIFRVSEYYVAPGSFSGTSYDLTLDQALAADYFVIVQGSDGDGTNGGSRGPDENYARVTQDPLGTGDLGTSTAADVIRLERSNAVNSWVGVVTVVESLAPTHPSAFDLLDVQVTTAANGSSSGSDASAVPWSDINQVMLMGGFNGAGCTTPDGSTSDTPVCHWRIVPSGTTGIDWTRNTNNGNDNAATSTIMVVEWGSDWTVQRRRIQGNNGGNGVDSTTEYDTAAISSVARDNTWIWGTGFTTDNGAGDSAEGVVLTLGDGVNQNATESTLAAGLEFGDAKDFEVYALTHPDLAVDYRFKPDGDTGALTVDVTVDTAGTDRMALSYNGVNTTSDGDHPRGMFSARFIADDTVRLERRRSDDAFPAWVQGIDWTAIEFSAALGLDNQGISSPQLADGAPPALVLPADGFTLDPGQSMMVTYRVEVDPGIDPNITTLPNTASVTTAEQPDPISDIEVDPIDPGAVIGDRVWLDTDGDGIEDIGEKGIADVEVILYEDPDGIPGNGDEIQIAATTTDSNGDYLFDHVYPLGTGNYYVEVTPSTLPAGLDPTPGNNGGVSGPLNPAPGDSILTVDFGYVPTSAGGGSAVIGDLLWSDDDADGVQDPGEVGIAGVWMALASDAGADGVWGTADDVIVSTVQTGSDGTYLFSNVSPGEYVVLADVGVDGIPGSGDETLAGAGYSPTVGPQSEGGFVSDPVTLAIGDVAADVDFGFNNPALFTVSDRVWLDADGDGTLDGSEQGIGGVTVELRDASGNVVGTTVTNTDGTFSFDGVPNGSYTVVVTDTNAVIEDLGGTTAAALADQLAVAVAGGDVTGVNFGYNDPSRVGDRVWSDVNGDGIQDAGEPGIGGVTVNLRALDGTLLETTSTAADGSYSFEGLNPDGYLVEVAPANFLAGGALEGYSQTGDPDASLDGQGTTSVTISSSDLTLDFGYQNSALADVSGNVFEDLDSDGLLESDGNDGIPGNSDDELGFSGVTVVLLNTAGDVVASTTTLADGSYIFADVPPGDYTVAVTDDDQVLAGYTLTSGLDALDITVGAGDISGVDFGYVREPGTASIGDVVFLDADQDGVRDSGEPGIAGVTVDLYDLGADGAPGGGDDVLVGSTVTDANGEYSFAGLPAGFYSVDVTDTGSVLTGLSLTSGADPTAPIAVSEGESYEEADFGYASAAATGSAIGDRVWYDADGDGYQDPGEVGIGGVEITVVGPSGSFVTTTAADGSWLVTGPPGTGLVPGTYTVSVNTTTLPPGYNTTPTNGLSVRTYDLVVGEDLLTADFGFNGGNPGDLSGTVYFDGDGDAVQDVPGEAGLEFVTVNLVDVATGEVVATTSTDANGDYSFLGVPSGDYNVVVTDLG
ncbi:MAG: carboxypeptidase regulatory-like domain-containing protein, partial [Acidimicrobiia bacterium]|nr:carboxypeptidase regulatory-like domain-containing protein [Acidimicrobiia bacterium]